MPKISRLTALKVARTAAPGMYPDGGGLYLQVTVNGKDGTPARSWVYRYMLRGRAREMGLGSLTAISLQEARARAGECRRQRHDGIDPIEARKAEREQASLDAGRALTFKEAANRYIDGHKAGWRNLKHAAQWENTLATYAHPVIGALSVQAIDTTLVLKVLEPIWTVKPETASRLRGRIESVLDWAKVRGCRKGENPARWRGHLDKLLPARSKVRSVQHHSALAYADMPDFMEALRQQEATGVRALEFTILTAARTGETIGARWDEIDMAGKVWTVPAGRMKAGREHRIPLSPRAVAILQEMTQKGDVERGPDQADAFVFRGAKRGKPLSNMAFLMLLRRMGRHDLTVHGFRSSFRDWAAERTHFPSEVAEMALAHTIGDKVEAAYRRSDLFEQRRRIMAEWAKFCGTPRTHAQNLVVPYRRKR
jgi:integrase